MKLKRWGRYDPVLWLIVFAFLVWELTAHFVLRNETGHTLSNRILWLETKGGIGARIFVASACVALAVHLEGAF